DRPPVCTDAERDYLIEFANRYFKRDIAASDVVWTYSGVRPLHADGSSSASAVTRDYTLKVDDDGAPILNIFGGKITTHRRLAEHAMEKLTPYLKGLPGKWTAGVPLPGGDFPVDGVPGLISGLLAEFSFLTPFWARRLVRAYGTEARLVMGDAKAASDLGEDFGATLSERELRWLMTREFARRAEDVVWRRGKLGLRLSAGQITHIDDWMKAAQG
ncbi:glycerol-3-phosphate dehydrogenase C-terminal domain-containing protein, partial [Pseudorhodobacter sp.]|uniref:glycerol-3-phosphate dehydrogenase C-terminal domain-containing protein n=1 Tax=Pseudorhodobacter sp. TaxID=1934400 RepID=UPI00264A0575